MWIQMDFKQEDPLTSMFCKFHEQMSIEQLKREEIRSVVKDVDQAVREMVAILQTVHKPEGLSRVDQLLKEVQLRLDGTVKTCHTSLGTLVNQSDFYKFHDQWKFGTQRLVFVAAFMQFLKCRVLLTWEEAAEQLHLSPNRSSETLHLDIEDYLHGLILLSNELSRLAVTSVTANNYDLPQEVALFLNELESGFRMLNLKNDSLRKRFDSIKYDLKKVEEVVYDITIRGMVKKPDS